MEYKDCNYLLETVKRIDKIQKEATLLEENTCLTCAKSLLTLANNTIPVRFILCSGNELTGQLGITGVTTSLFRIEEIRCDRYLTLRMLEICDGVIGSNYTMIFDLECACGLVCSEAVQVTPCNVT